MKRYIDRTLIKGPHVALITSEKDYLKEMRRLHVEGPPPYVSSGADATTHILESDAGGVIALVCMEDRKASTTLDDYGSLVHEAVHVWRQFKESIGEQDPSWEFEAYSIQTIAQNLMVAWRDRRK